MMALFRNDRVGGRVGDRRLLAHAHSPGGGHDSPEGWIQVKQILIAQIWLKLNIKLICTVEKNAFYIFAEMQNIPTIEEGRAASKSPH